MNLREPGSEAFVYVDQASEFWIEERALGTPTSHKRTPSFSFAYIDPPTSISNYGR